jgi:hypothetical protein
MLTPPPIQPFKRLRIYDGLSIDADRWQFTHRYHRHRQNFHYQAINQGGIVRGLGVYPISDPHGVLSTGNATAQATLQTASRWVKIQPGIAIDGAGNPIIVPESITFQLQSEIRAGESNVIYLVVNYCDPDDLRQIGNTDSDYVQEQFRIQERTSLDPILDVELCRIQLSAAKTPIRLPLDAMDPAPGLDTIDFNHRQSAQVKADGVRVGMLGNQGGSQNNGDRWHRLTQSLPALYPRLEASPKIGQIPLIELPQTTDLLDYDLLSITQVDLLSQLNHTDELNALKTYLKTGGVLLVHIDPLALNISELTSLAQELQRAIADGSTPDFQQQQLREELQGVKEDIRHQLEQIPNQLTAIGEGLANPIQGSGAISYDHPLQSQPFLFGQLPTVNGQSLYLLNWGGIVVMVGDLSLHWIGDEMLTREAIRSAQELGINLLQFAGQRRQRMALMRS